jgi:hypothetical protein
MTCDDIVARFARCTRVRPRSTFTKADCPVCQRKRRVEIREGTQGRVLVHAHCGCDRDAVLGAAGLAVSDLFPARCYEPLPPSRRPAEAVLRHVRSERFTITTHDFAGNEDLALAVELLERLVAARARANLTHFWGNVPITVRFLQREAERIGKPIGLHRSRRLIDLLQERGYIEFVGWYRTRSRWMRIFTLPLALVTRWTTKALAYTSEPAATLHLRSGSRMSRALRRECERAVELLEHLTRWARPPPPPTFVVEGEHKPTPEAVLLLV